MDILAAEKNGINTLTSKTGSSYADTDLIQLYANDGTPNGKIARSALMSCVKDSLGTLLNQGAADLGTSLAKIPALNSGGTLGSATVANLASVLGVPSPKNFPEGTDLDTIIEPGVYFAQNVSVSGSTLSGILMVYITNIAPWYQNLKRLVQEFVRDSSSNTQRLMRLGTFNSGTVTWSNWHEVSLDIPTFYKDYQNISALAAGVGAVYTAITTETDLNTVTQAGIYMCSSSGISKLSNKPNLKAAPVTIEVIGQRDMYVVQRIFTVGYPDIFVRTKGHGSSGTWTNWAQLQVQ